MSPDRRTAVPLAPVSLVCGGFCSCGIKFGRSVLRCIIQGSTRVQSGWPTVHLGVLGGHMDLLTISVSHTDRFVVFFQGSQG